MAAINSILAGRIAPFPEAGGQPSSGPPSQDYATGTVSSRDVFVQGEWWANQAPLKGQGGSGTSRNEGVQYTQEYALRAYGMQQQSGRPQRGADEEQASPGGPRGEGGAVEEPEKNAKGEARSTGQSQERKPDGSALNDQELREIVRLKRVDTQVRAHEMAHLAVAGSYARGGASFQYKKGPDGQNYAVGGEVPIDVAREATPEATIKKMQTVKAAALAPADPSPQDRKVAATAVAALGEARQELRLQRLAEMAGRGEKNGAIAPESGPQQRGSEEIDGQAASTLSGVSEKGRRQLIGNYLNPGKGNIAEKRFAAVG